MPANNDQGFSYIEVLMSLLILSSGILGYAVLMTRIQLVQLQSNQTLKEVLMVDYMVTQLAISSEICSRLDNTSKAEHSCQLRGVLPVGIYGGQVGVFDGSNPLLEGYAASDLYAVGSAGGLGCISFDTASMTYIIGLFFQGANSDNVTGGACDDQTNSFRSATRYIALPAKITANSG